MRTTTLAALQKRLGYRFADPQRLEVALTHRSRGRANNERLEFLGDAILGAVVAELLFRRYPELSERDLTLARAELVQRSTLAGMARALDIGGVLQVSGPMSGGGALQFDSLLADALEAVIGAVHEDGGFHAAHRMIEHLFGDLLDSAARGPSKDPKTRLQEWIQARAGLLPVYRLVGEDGPPHARQFTVECRVAHPPLEASASGRSLREAEKRAAEHLLNLLEGAN